MFFIYLVYYSSSILHLYKHYILQFIFYILSILYIFFIMHIVS